MRFFLIFCVLAVFAACSQLSIVGAVDASKESRGKGWLSGIREKLLAFVAASVPQPAADPTAADALPGLPIISQEAKDQLLADAEAALEAADVEKALDSLLPILEADPDHQEANALVGAILLSLNQSETAEALLYTAVTVSNFTDYRSAVNLATALRQRGETGLALRVLMRTANGTDQDDAVASLSRGIGDCYYALTNYSEAADWYLNSALRLPLDAEAWVRASTIRFPQGAVDVRFAENVLLQGMASNAKSSVLIHHLGLVLLRTQRVGEAALLFEEAADLDAANAEAVAAAATAYHALGRSEPALRYYALALRQQPENAVLLANCCRLLHRIGRTEEALPLLATARKLQPDNAEVLQAVKELAASQP